jgi:hypothetical protein
MKKSKSKRKRYKQEVMKSNYKARVKEFVKDLKLSIQYSN